MSTPKQAYEGESLDVQAAICTDIANSNGWTVAREPWKESFSGRKLHRPVFQDVLAFLDDHPGLVRYYLFRSIDRATRGGSYSYEKMKRALHARGVVMVDSYGVIQPVTNTLHELGFEYEWSVSSPSEIAEVVVATSAKADLTNTLTRLIGQEIRLRQRGYKVRNATDGFQNTRVAVDGRKRVIETPDPERARYFVAMFDMRASGQFTDREICERVNAMGYRRRQFNRWDSTHQQIVGQAGGGLLTPKRLQEIIRRPIYCGIICEKWTRHLPVKAAYDGLVSIETFNAANRGMVSIHALKAGGFEIRYQENGVRPSTLQKDNPNFPLRKVVRCSICRKPFLGSSPRGKSGRHFPTYHCARNHKYLGVPKATFERVVAGYVSRLRFRPESIRSMRGVLVEKYDEQQVVVEALAQSAKRTVVEIELRKAATVRAFTVTTIDSMRRGLEADIIALDKELEEARHVRNGLGIAAPDIDDFLNDAAAIMEHPAILLKRPANASQLETLYDLVFEAFPTYAEMADGTPELAWIFYLSSDLLTSESALVRLRGLEWNTIACTILKWKTARDDLQPLLHHAPGKRRTVNRSPQRP